ncbi:hypothetical protein J4206_03780 [Candidatus Woesearchaeota archaeon]|nr:hypothetical protein [Candidatus Woesearchaeota archaeon]
MTIKRDALELLAEMYNYKIEGKTFDLDEIMEALNFTTIRLENAYNYLLGHKLLTEQVRLIGTTLKGLPHILGLEITSKGIDAIEEEDVFKQNFGSLKIEINQNGHVNVINTDDSQSTNNISTPILSNSSYINAGNLNNSNIINHNIIDNAKRYNISKREISFIKNLSINLINRFGEKKLKVIAIISFIVSVITYISGIATTIPEVFHPPQWLPKISIDWMPYIMLLPTLLLGLGVFLVTIVKYKYESRCTNCKEFYALEEVGDADVKEVEAYEGVHQTITRTYKCNKCGNIEQRGWKVFIKKSSRNS